MYFCILYTLELLTFHNPKLRFLWMLCKTQHQTDCYLLLLKPSQMGFDNLSDFAPTPLVLALQRKISYMENQLYHQITVDFNLNVLKVWDRFKVFEFIFDPFSHGEDSPGILTRFRKGHFVSENPCLSISCFPLYSYITSNIYVICFILSNEYSYIHTFSEHGR